MPFEPVKYPGENAGSAGLSGTFQPRDLLPDTTLTVRRIYLHKTGSALKILQAVPNAWNYLSNLWK